MKKVRFVFLLAIFLSFFLGLSISSKPKQGVVQPTTTALSVNPIKKALVARVIDGDTISVDMDGKKESVRLIGINSPETLDPRKKVECFGKQASDKAKELLTGKTISLEKDSTQGDRDKYGRLLRYVFLEDGTNFDKLMVDLGYAHEYTYDTPYKYQQEFRIAEQKAREGKMGLWADDKCTN